MKTSEKIEKIAEICAAKSGYVKSDRERLEVAPWYLHNVFMKGFLKGYKAALPEVKITDSKKGWVSVEDMPKKATYYLICQKRDFDGYSCIDVAYYNNVEFVFSSEQPYDINNEFWKVTHWMPLPAPPTQDKEPDIVEEEFELERLFVAKTERNVEVIGNFIEHCKNEGLNIPDKHFESFFDA